MHRLRSSLLVLALHLGCGSTDDAQPGTDDSDATLDDGPRTDSSSTDGGTNADTTVSPDARDGATPDVTADTPRPDVDGAVPTDSPWVPAGYALVFGDEFNGTALDTSKWWTRYVYSDGTLDRLNDEKQRYRENGNHVMTGTSVKLTVKKTSTSDPDGIDYESGMLRSKTILKYGYFEARVKMPPFLGAWPAFWLNGETGGWPPEIDIFEFVNNGVEDKVDMLHTGVIDHGAQGGAFLFTDTSFHTDWTYWKAPFDFPDAFHVVALLWDETSAATYVDGKMIVERGYKWLHDDGSDGGFAHVLLNLAVGGSWAGRHGIDDKAFPQNLEVDYVRVYQSKVDTAVSKIGHDLCPATGGC